MEGRSSPRGAPCLHPLSLSAAAESSATHSVAWASLLEVFGSPARRSAGRGKSRPLCAEK